MGKFKDKQQVFKNEDVLGEDYEPDEILERDDEEDKLINALMPVFNGAIPNNIFVYGDTGVGKSVVTKSILDELKADVADVDDVSVETVWLNCKDHTEYEVRVNLVNEFRDSDNQISETGHSKQRVISKLWEEIDNTDASHILFVLDEIDSLGTEDDILYQIPRSRSNGYIKNTKIGIIGICNDFSYRKQLSPRVTSTLCETEIQFGPYDANQLKSILRQRAKKAFEPGVLDDSAISVTGALAGNDTGSARHALNILRRAGELLRGSDDNTVTDKHARAAYDDLERSVLEDELMDLPTQSDLVLHALLEHTRRENTPVGRNEIYRLYEQIAEQNGKTIKTKRTVHDRLSQLSLKGFIQKDSINRGRDGGMKYLYELNDPDMIQTVLSQKESVTDTDSNLKLTDF